MSLTLIIGGVRSGKSRYAQQIAKRLDHCPVYLATSRHWDGDYSARIARHVQDRGPEWQTAEHERELSDVRVTGHAVVVDCVTLWLTNFFADEGRDTERCLELATSVLERTLALDNHWIFVTNEVGQSLHAPTEAGRRFTDLQGFMNQRLAARADNVAMMVAGLAHYIKGVEPQP